MKLLLTLLCFLTVFSFSQVLNPQLYMIDGFDLKGEDFQIFKSDSSTVITGRGWDNDSPKYIMKINQSGHVDTVISVDTTNDVQFWSLGKPSKFNILESLDSNVLLLSTSHSIGNQFCQKMRKLSVNLNSIWEKNYQFPFSSFHSSFTELSNGNLLFDSYNDSINAVTMTDSAGNTLWSRSFVNNIIFYNNHFSESGPDHFIASFGSSSGSILQKWHRNGSLIWSKSIQNFEIFSILTDSIGNNYLLSHDIPSTNICLVKTDSNGNVTQSTKLDATLYFYDNMEGNIHFYNDDVIFGFGPWNSTSRGHYLETDTSLSIQNFYISAGGHEQLTKFHDSIFVLESSGGAYYSKLVGPRELGVYRYHQTFNCRSSLNFNQNSIAFNFTVDTTSLDTISVIETPLTPNYAGHNGHLYGYGCPLLQYGSTNEYELSKLSIYPNPSRGIFTIETEEGKMMESLKIYSAEGRLIYTNENIKKSKAQINLNTIPTGIYYIKAHVGNEFVFEKVLISD